MLEKNWQLGFLGFLGFISITAFTENPLNILWALWFFWFRYFIPTRLHLHKIEFDRQAELEKDEIFKKLQITITIVIFFLVLIKTFMAAGFDVPENCSVNDVTKQTKTTPDLVYGGMSASVAAYVILLWLFIWKRESITNSKIISWSNKILTHNFLLLGILILYVSNVTSLITSICGDGLNVGQQILMPLLLVMSKIYIPLLLLYSIVVPGTIGLWWACSSKKSSNLYK